MAPAGNGSKIRWAPKVAPAKLRQLYELDAQGIVDEELIDQVAYGFYARCQSILAVTEAARHGRIRCPACEHVILRRGYDPDQRLCCPDCGWAITWGAYKRTYVGRQLHGGGAVDVFQEYVRHLPEARTHRDKMLLIDWVVHRCHRGLVRQAYRHLRPVAVNLIEGSMGQVIRLLEGLAYGPNSIEGTDARRERWGKEVLAGVRHPEKWISPELVAQRERADDTERSTD
jgi:hypothetical protein